jgi:hypothetical protein
LEAISKTPLSDLIAAHRAKGTSQSYARFLDGFRGAMLGVVAAGLPKGAAGEVVSCASQPVSVGMTQHAGGRPMVLAFADPVAFARRFGAQFNAEISGEALLATALLNRECQGVLVNSALADVSIVIDRVTAESLTRPAGDSRQSGRKPWWKFW